jgi:hypothetical protein
MIFPLLMSREPIIRNDEQQDFSIVGEPFESIVGRLAAFMNDPPLTHP